MKLWVVKADDGSLAIIGTSGFEPHNALCEARPDWDAKTLTWDSSAKICFVDPDKVRKAHKSEIKASQFFSIVRQKSFVESHWRKGVLGVAILVLMAIAIGYYLS